MLPANMNKMASEIVQQDSTGRHNVIAGKVAELDVALYLRVLCGTGHAMARVHCCASRFSGAFSRAAPNLNQ